MCISFQPELDLRSEVVTSSNMHENADDTADQDAVAIKAGAEADKQSSYGRDHGADDDGPHDGELVSEVAVARNLTLRHVAGEVVPNEGQKSGDDNGRGHGM